LTVPGRDGPDRPGASTFTIEGRSAPGLFVVGWLATLLGLGAIFVAFMAGPGAPATILLIAGAGGQAVERRARGGPFTGPSPFLLFAATIPVVGLLLFGAGAIFEVLGIPVDGPLGRLASVLLQALVYVGLIRLLVVDTGALSWTEMGISRPTASSLRDLATGAAWAFPVILATIPVAAIITRFIPVAPTSPLPPTGELAGFVVNLLAGVVVAPVSEEIMFRGYATTAWMRGMEPIRGVVRGALFFAVVHVLTISGVRAGEALAVAAAAFLGRVPVALALGWLFARRKTIWAPLGLHATFNGVLLILAELAARNGVAPL
jgi:membrane protease YdiL (CAAX protease family)